MKKVFLAFILGIIMLAPVACSKRTETVQPNETTKTNVRKDKNVPLTLTEQLAADVDFRASADLMKNLAESSQNYLNSLTESQKNSIQSAYQLNPTEENLLNLLGMNPDNFNSMRNLLGVAKNRVLGNESISISDQNQIVGEAYQSSFPIEWMIIGHTIGCLINYLNAHEAIGGAWQSGTITTTQQITQLNAAKDALGSCLSSPWWR